MTNRTKRTRIAPIVTTAAAFLAFSTLAACRLEPARPTVKAAPREDKEAELTAQIQEVAAHTGCHPACTAPETCFSGCGSGNGYCCAIPCRADSHCPDGQLCNCGSDPVPAGCSRFSDSVPQWVCFRK